MLREKMVGVTYDNLLGGPEIPVLTANVTITGAKALKRGSLLKNTDGKFSLVATGDDATAVLKEDIDVTTADAVGVIYVTGRFNREALIVADGDTVAAHEEQLRRVGILLTSIR